MSRNTEEGKAKQGHKSLVVPRSVAGVATFLGLLSIILVSASLTVPWWSVHHAPPGLLVLTGLQLDLYLFRIEGEVMGQKIHIDMHDFFDLKDIALFRDTLGESQTANMQATVMSTLMVLVFCVASLAVAAARWFSNKDRLLAAIASFFNLLAVTAGLVALIAFYQFVMEGRKDKSTSLDKLIGFPANVLSVPDHPLSRHLPDFLNNRLVTGALRTLQPVLPPLSETPFAAVQVPLPSIFSSPPGNYGDGYHLVVAATVLSSLSTMFWVVRAFITR